MSGALGLAALGALLLLTACAGPRATGGGGTPGAAGPPDAGSPADGPAATPAVASSATPAAARAAVDAVLEALHAAAAAGDGPTYFDLFTADAVFLGTDATERWPMDAFRVFAEPYFDGVEAWTYHPVSRSVAFGPDGAVAWFDELLDNASYGRVRGSGVLLREDGRWRVAQYVLSFTVPNDAAADVVERIRAEPPPDGDA